MEAVFCTFQVDEISTADDVTNSTEDVSWIASCRVRKRGAVHRIDCMHTLHLLLCPFWRYQAQGNMNPADYQDAFLLLHLSGHICRELPIAGIDLTRFQRASEGAHHSSSCRRDDVVDGGSMGFP